MRLDDPRQPWEDAVSAVVRRVNTAVWLERFAPFAFAALSLGAGLHYALRRLREPSWGGHLAVALLVAGTAFYAAWLARRAYFDRRAARALLEYHQGLDSRLSAAAAGVAAWPDSPPTAGLTWLRWTPGASLRWLAAGLIVLAAGLWLPVPAPAPGFSQANEKPPALAQTEAWLEQVNQLALAEPESIEALSERARGLAERSPESQYTHSALEAADTLRAQTEAAIRSLAAELDAAAAAMAPLENPAAALSEEELGALASRLGSALQGLREGRLAANGELLKGMPPANAAGLRSLTPEQAAQLRQQLARAGRAATGVVGAQGKGASVASADPDGQVTLRQGEGFGSGSPERGPGHAPLYLNSEASDAGAGRTETVNNPELARAALGDLLGTERGEHELDPTRSAAPSAAGSIATPGRGGDVVWVDHLTPAERAALKDFFK
jgi:hypothetical protein